MNPDFNRMVENAFQNSIREYTKRCYSPVLDHPQCPSCGGDMVQAWDDSYYCPDCDGEIEEEGEDEG